MNRPPFLGAAAVALGVASVSLLAPQAASAAFDVTFSFGGVSGLITGLVDGNNPCGSGCVVNVTNAGISGAPTGPYNYFSGTGFNFSEVNRAVTSADWGGFSEDSMGFLNLDTTGLASLQLPPATPTEEGPVVFRTLPFTSGLSAVPGPLPFLGAAAAFGYSRKLRKRIKGCSNTGSTSPFV